MVFKAVWTHLFAFTARLVHAIEVDVGSVGRRSLQSRRPQWSASARTGQASMFQNAGRASVANTNCVRVMLSQDCSRRLGRVTNHRRGLLIAVGVQDTAFFTVICLVLVGVQCRMVLLRKQVNLRVKEMTQLMYRSSVFAFAPTDMGLHVTRCAAPSVRPATACYTIQCQRRPRACCSKPAWKSDGTLSSTPPVTAPTMC